MSIQVCGHEEGELICNRCSEEIIVRQEADLAKCREERDKMAEGLGDQSIKLDRQVKRIQELENECQQLQDICDGSAMKIADNGDRIQELERERDEARSGMMKLSAGFVENTSAEFRYSQRITALTDGLRKYGWHK